MRVHRRLQGLYLVTFRLSFNQRWSGIKSKVKWNEETVHLDTQQTNEVFGNQSANLGNEGL